jgi:hypothetical protein
MRYKLLKDLPYVKAGAIYELDALGDYKTYDESLKTRPDFKRDTLSDWVVENNLSWFEPISESDDEIEELDIGNQRWLDSKSELLYQHKDLNALASQTWWRTNLTRDKVNELVKAVNKLNQLSRE